MSSTRTRGQPVPLLSPEELASLLGVPVKTVYRWRSRGEGPVALKVGRHVRYRLDEVHDWLDSRAERREHG
jgi:excisionase family DNA binding protein